MKGHDQKVAKTQERPDKKEMRKLAKNLSIDGWEQMNEDRLWTAIKKAQKIDAKAPPKAKAKTNGHGKVTKAPRGKTKADKGEPVTPSQKAKATKTKAEKPAKAKKTKKSTPKTERAEREPAENGNPFRPGSNAFMMTELFFKGGLRSAMIEKLLKKIEFRPWAKKAKDIDVRHEMDKRMLMATHQLQHKYGFTVLTYGGRGPDKGGIKVFAPGEKVPVEWQTKALTINGKRTGETAKPAKKTARTTKKAVAGKTVRKSTTKPAKAKKKATGTTKAKAAKKSGKKAKK